MLGCSNRENVLSHANGAKVGSSCGGSRAQRKRRSRSQWKRDGAEEVVYVKDRKAGQTYIKGSILGRGGFAKCYEFVHVGSQHVCAGKCVNKKTLEKNSRARSKLHSEIKIHRSLRHRKVVRFEHFFEDSSHVYILLELCTKQTLMELVKRKRRLKESHVRHYVLQLLEGVKYLHGQKVIHRDLKLGNLFLNENMEIRIGDFGLATRLEYDEQRKMTVCGTPNYIAPEIICGKKGHSYEVDIWSIGIILYTMLIGRPPFETRDVKTTYKRIQANDYSFPEAVPISFHARDIITKILTQNPADRPSLDEIKQHRLMLLPGTASEASARQALAQVTISANNKPKPAAAEKSLEGVKTPIMPRSQSKSFQHQSVDANNCFPEDKENGPSSACSYLWVSKYVDYTSKYGIGYLLRGGIVGIYFNDSTKLVVASDRKRFDYYRRQSEKKESYTLDKFPKDLTKKVTLLKHFRSYLEKKRDEDTRDMEYSAWVSQDKMEQKAREEVEQLEKENQDLPYVKKWVRTRHAIFFRLSNRKVQVTFFDGTEILLSARQRIVTYIDKGKKSTTLPVSETATKPSIAARLKYTKEVLNQLIQQDDKKTSSSRKPV